jgi:hypothetical protein
MNKMKALKITGWAILGTAFLALALYLISLILSALWNWLMPDLFNLPEITLWQALGIFILSKLLFTPGLGHGREERPPRRQMDWKARFKNKMSEHRNFNHGIRNEDKAENPEGVVTG